MADHPGTASYPDSKKPFHQTLGPGVTPGSDLQPMVDVETNVTHLARGDSGQTTIRDLGPGPVSPVLLVDKAGNAVRLTEGGALCVVQAAQGVPFVANAIVGSDAWVAVFIVNRDCHYLSIGCETSGLRVGFGLPGTSGVVGGPGVVSDANVADNLVFPGLLIPAGTTVYVKNQVAAVNAANGTVAAW